MIQYARYPVTGRCTVYPHEQAYYYAPLPVNGALLSNHSHARTIQSSHAFVKHLTILKPAAPMQGNPVFEQGRPPLINRVVYSQRDNSESHIKDIVYVYNKEIDNIISSPYITFDKATLIGFLKQELIHKNSTIINKTSKERLHVLSLQACNFLNSFVCQTNLHPVASQLNLQRLDGDSAYYKKNNPTPSENHKVNPRLDRSPSQLSLSSYSTASSQNKPPVEKKPSYSKLFDQATKLLEENQSRYSPLKKIYPGFYKHCFFNTAETIIDPVINNKQPYCASAFIRDKVKILNTSYNNFHPSSIFPLGGKNFFHQQQTGPYCQTVSINNLLGDYLLTPDLITEKLNLGGNISTELGTSGSLEILSKIREEQAKTLSSLINSQDGFILNRNILKEISHAKYLLKELNCRACDIEKNNQRQIQKFIEAAEKSNINRLHLTFVTKYNNHATNMHAIALRKDPVDPRLWIVLDGNLPAYRLSLKNALTSYAEKGTVRLIARKDLFKTDPSIACYQIKRKFNGSVCLTEPTPTWLSQWQNSNNQANSPGRSANDFEQWKIRQQRIRQPKDHTFC